jgi:hypothetical protein
MIRFLVASGFAYTFNSLVLPDKRLRELPMEVWHYRRLFGQPELPPGTWIFCDIERLAVWELRLAGEIARLMREAGPQRGFRVLNDPARAAARYELLLRLNQQGFNHFRAWRAEDGLPSARFPVFLRIESNHGQPISDLIETPEALAAEIDALPGRGIARRGVLIVEYQAQPLEPGVFRKYGAYRFGDRIVADHLVHDVGWAAKYGNPKAWTAERFAEELDYVRTNPHADALMRAFQIAGIEYGRADYGLIDGMPQIWEINTNPVQPSSKLEKVRPVRREAMALARDNRLAAIEALDLASGNGPLENVSDLLTAHRDRQVPGLRDLVRE